MSWLTHTLVAGLFFALGIIWGEINPLPFADRFAPAVSLPASTETSQPAKPKSDKLPLKKQVA